MHTTVIKENIITDYKQITKQLSDKLERREKGEKEDPKEPLTPGEAKQPLETALARIQVKSLFFCQNKR